MSKKSPAVPDLNLETLSSLLPTQYRRWLRAGIAAVALGYSLALASLMFEGRITSVWTAREIYVIGLALFAGLLERAGRLRACVFVLLGSVWTELHISLVEEGVHSIAVCAFCALLVGVFVCLGRRAAVWGAAAALFTVPGSVALGWEFGRSAPRQSGDLATIAILLAAIVTTAVLLHLFMDAFSRVLLQSESNRLRARELVDDAPDVVIALSDRGTVEDLNAAAVRILRLDRAAALGKPFEDLPLIAVGDQSEPPSRQRSGELPREYVVAGSGEILEGLFRKVTRADGSAGLLVWLRDVTLRNRAMEQTAVLQDQLQHSQKLEALGRLAGGVAHDFNNLLTTVGGYADLIARHADPRIRDVAAELSSIRERGKGLTRQLLAFARKEKASPQAVDLSEALSGMAGLLSKLLLDQVELQLELEPDTVVSIDPGQLQQLVINLVVNAKDAMPQGGALRLTSRFVAAEDRVELAVSDTGLGMDPATRARVFEPFFTTKPRGKGTGLGLSMVHGIVEASHGKIEIESTPGEGTTLTLSWPRHYASDRVSRPTLSPQPRVKRQGNLMVVEDDPEGRTLLTSLLREEGYSVIAAKNGADALQQLDVLAATGQKLDLLLSDVRMPILSGPELALALRERLPELPVLFVSGYYEADLEGAELPHAMDVLPKPYTTRELLSRIERAMRQPWAERARPA